MKTPRVAPTRHFLREMDADDITWDEILSAWLDCDLDRESLDHPGFRVRTSRTLFDGTRVSVVARVDHDAVMLEMVTTWRSRL